MYPSYPTGDILDKNDRDVDRSVTQLAFGPLDRFLAVGTAGDPPGLPLLYAPSNQLALVRWIGS